MANKIMFKSDGDAGTSPTTSECTISEPCWNKRDGRLFIGGGAGDNGTTSTGVKWVGGIIRDEDDMATAESGSGAYGLATQQSIKAYVDTGIGTRIKILPSDFVPNDDSTYYNVAIDDSTAAMEVRNAYLEVWCFKDIPPGYKATDCKIYVNASLVLKIYEIDITGASVPVALTTSGDTDDVIDFSASLSGDMTSSTTNAIALTVITTSTSNLIYGGYISIQRV